jgi:hypothetical protein
LEIERDIKRYCVHDDCSEEVGYDETCSGIVAEYFQRHDWEVYARLDEDEEREAKAEYH